MENIHVEKVLTELKNNIQKLNADSQSSADYSKRVSYVKHLISTLEDMNDPYAYYSLIELANSLSSIDFFNGYIDNTFNYAQSFIGIVDMPNIDEVSDIDIKQREMFSMVYLTLAMFVLSKRKDYEDNTADELLGLSFVYIPNTDVLKKLVYRYVSKESTLSFKDIKVILDIAKNSGLYEAYIYDILISHGDANLDTHKSFDDFYTDVNDDKKGGSIISYLESFVYSNLSTMDTVYKNKYDFYAAVIPIYCFMFVVGVESIAAELDIIFKNSPKYVEILKTILSKEDLVRYVEVVNKYRSL